jgi:hypothetical protein
MDVTAQVISIAAAIAILVFIAGWMILRQRDKKEGDASRKTSGQATPRSRRDARWKDKTTGKTNRAAQESPPAWKGNRSGGAPEKDRVVSTPELKNSASHEDKVFTITPPGKNGRPKH